MKPCRRLLPVLATLAFAVGAAQAATNAQIVRVPIGGLVVDSVPARLAVSSTAIGSQVLLGQRAVFSLPVSNTGKSPLSLSQMVGGDAASDYGVSGCGSQVAAGASCNLAINFTPQARGARSAQLALTSNGGNVSVPLSGVGIIPAALQMNVSPLVFAATALQQSAQQQVQLGNAGDLPLSIQSAVLSGTNAAEFSVTGCQDSVSPGASCVLSVVFAPTTGGAKAAQLNVSSSGGSGAISLSGQGLALAVLHLGTNSLSFSTTQVGIPVTQTLSVANTGGQPLTVSSTKLTGANAADYSVSGCSQAVGPSSSCTLTISYSPSTTDGSSASLSVVSNGGDDTVTLSGSVNDPYFKNVVALLPLTAATGSPPILDVIGGAWTAQNASLSGAQAKMGTGSLAFSSTSRGVGPTYPLSGDFTIEEWVYPTVNGSNVPLICEWKQVVGNGNWCIYLSNGVVGYTFGPYSEGSPLVSGGSVPVNAWSHVAVTRQGATFRLFVNGSQVSTASFAAAGRTQNITTTLGNYYASNGAFPAVSATNFTGYMQQIRITKDVARYTGNFVPSRAPLPTHP
jgi:P pilus assembly chaperone PapD